MNVTEDRYDLLIGDGKKKREKTRGAGAERGKIPLHRGRDAGNRLDEYCMIQEF